MHSGLLKTLPDHRDFSVLHSFGAITPDPKSLPDTFSIYDGQVIPNQELEDNRFSPPVRPLPYGCTGEAQSFIGGLEDGGKYRPDDLYDNTPPYVDNQGRDMRLSMQTTITRGFKDNFGVLGYKRTHYYNVYGVGPVDDFDAARIALYLFQGEKRAVSVGSWWYGEFENPVDGIIPTPSFNTNQASMHNWIATGWKDDMLECISWQGMDYGDNGKVYIPRVIYNALMRQPFTAAMTLTKNTAATPVPLGMQVWIDHLVYWLMQLFTNATT